MRELILIRTHQYNEAIGELHDYLSRTSDRDVAIICDDTAGCVDVGPGRVKLGITEGYVKSLGLHVPTKFGWLCGDYFLYAANKMLPDYDRYWMIEADVRFSFAESRVFFDTFAEGDADAYAFHIFKSKSDWYWNSPMKYFASDVYACLFPVVAISKAAVETAFAERIEMSKTFDSIVPLDEKRRWPNDESFLMTTLYSKGLKVSGLNSDAKKFSNPETFNVGLPKSHKRIQTQRPDNLIYHPVHAGNNFTAKANTWLNEYLYNKASLDVILDKFSEEFLWDLKLEATEEDYTNFKRRLYEIK